MTVPIEITMISDPSNIGVVRVAVEAFCGRHGFTTEQTEQIGLALNEALANVIEHGYEGNTCKRIHIAMDMLSNENENGPAVKLVIRDYGKHVDPDCIKSRNLDEIRPGGLGVHIIKTIMDDVRYRCAPEGGMELTMVKYVGRLKEARV